MSPELIDALQSTAIVILTLAELAHVLGKRHWHNHEEGSKQ